MSAEPITNARLEAILAPPSIDVRTGSTSAPLVLQAEARQMAAELLNLRRRDEELGLRYEPSLQLLELFGTRFARPVLEQFRVSSGADEYYQHARHEDGAVIVTRWVGMRQAVELLRQCLAARPSPDNLTEAQFRSTYLEWSSGAELLLEVGPREMAQAAAAVEELLTSVQIFRETCQPSGDEHTAETHQAQLVAAGQLFAKLEAVHRSRARLILWGLEKPPGYGTCMGCGCTDERACEGGCSWSDPTHTLCSKCAERVEHAVEGIER